MSDFQLGLLILGVAVVILVVAFNIWQERKYRRAALRAFDAPTRDVLSDAVPAGAVPFAGGVDEGTPVSAKWQDGVGDTQDIAAQDPAPAPQVPLPPQTSLATLINSETAGWTLDGADWTAITQGLPDENVVIAPPSDARLITMARLESQVDGKWSPWRPQAAALPARIALQLANRGGRLGDAEFAAFSLWLNDLAQRTGVTCPAFDAREAGVAAAALDAFCGEVDIQIAVHIRRGGGPFLGTRIRALAEASGLTQDADGVFRRRDDLGIEEFRLANEGPEIFTSDSMRDITSDALILEIDIPTAAGGMLAFNRFRQFAEHLASGLNASMVDDNGAALTSVGLDAIARQVSAVYKRMQERGIAPGSAVALRLFS